MNSNDFVKRLFCDYYIGEYSSYGSYSSVEKREFGFQLFEGWMLRHKNFQNHDELREFLQNSVPSDAYYSCAYYENPTADMDKKGWLGADLIFDIDADHIPTLCNKIHDEWKCSDCHSRDKGPVPETCPACGSKKLEVKTWPCEVCLDSAKTETTKLIDMLVSDFGFSKKEIRVFFSGHRGYHVHIENDAIKGLEAIGRKEIVDYVLGLGYDFLFHGLNGKERKIVELRGPRVSASGWDKRVFDSACNFVRNAKKEDFSGMGLRGNLVDILLENRDAILKNWEDLGSLCVVKGVSSETLKKIMGLCLQNLSAKIDTVVTTDIHRLIRLPNTLHGKTGMKKVEFSVADIGNFDPFTNAITFRKGNVTVFVASAPEFRLQDETFGPYQQQKVDLPTAAALLLVCKGKAEVAE